VTLGELSLCVGVIQSVPGEPLIGAPGVGGAGVADNGRTQRNHLPHQIWPPARQHPRHHSAQRPADKADLLTGFGMNFLKACDQPLALLPNRLGAKVPSQFPGARVIAAMVKEAAEQPGGPVCGHKAGQDEHRMAVSLRCIHQGWRGPGQCPHFEQSARQLSECQKKRWCGHMAGGLSVQIVLPITRYWTDLTPDQVAG
jgi:hypothetical protein